MSAAVTPSSESRRGIPRSQKNAWISSMVTRTASSTASSGVASMQSSTTSTGSMSKTSLPKVSQRSGFERQT